MSTESMWCNLHEEPIEWSTFKFKGCWGCQYFSGLDPEGYLHVSQAAELLEVSTDTVLQWIKKGVLDGRKYINGRKMFNFSSWKIYIISRESVEKLLSGRDKLCSICKE